MPRNQPNVTGFEELADRYAAELTAQFRTLSIFAKHAGEIGRTHEVFLGQVLARFLPARLRIGTGFVLSPSGITRQQDIIVYDWQHLPLLLTVGDCVVVDADAVAATIEVKTRLHSKDDFLDALRQLSEQASASRGSAAIGLYMWEGLSLDSAVGCFWEIIRERTQFGLSPLPHFVYVRGSYLLVPNWDGRIETAPLLALRLGEGHSSEGVGLLALVARLWLMGVQRYAPRPWWLEAWERSRSGIFEPIAWPPDLQERADAQLRELGGTTPSSSPA